MTIKDELCPTVKVDARLLDDGTLWITTDKIADIGRVIVEDGKTSCKQFYQDAQPEPCEIEQYAMSKELKPCPFRIHGERTASLTVAGEFFYNETFMPCMGEECACFRENSVDAYCDRNGAFMTMTKEVTE